MNMSRPNQQMYPLELNVDVHDGEHFLGRFKTSAMGLEEIRLAETGLLDQHTAVDIAFNIEYGINKHFEMKGIVSQKSGTAIRLNATPSYLEYFKTLNRLLMPAAPRSAQPESSSVRGRDLCYGCAAYSHCIVSNLQAGERQQLMSQISRQSDMAGGLAVYRKGESFRYLRLLRSGIVKTWRASREGNEHIIRFHFPGDILGLGAISSSVHDCNATTIDASSFCHIPFTQYQRLAKHLPALNEQLLRLMSREISEQKHLIELRGNRSARARLAIFLNDLAKRLDERGFSSKILNLPMSRRDIADYLGLAEETVSRAFGKLEDEGVLEVQRKNVRIYD